MKNSSKTVASCALFSLALCGLTLPASADDTGRSAVPHSLIGAWTSVVTHVDCVSGSLANPPPFKAHETFNLGGTYNQFGAGLGNRRSTGFGTWRRTGRTTFTASFTFFSFDAATGTIPVAIVKIDRQITISGPHELSSINQSTITTLDGVPLANACSTEVGTRL
jgi:hypothetical protein